MFLSWRATCPFAPSWDLWRIFLYFVGHIVVLCLLNLCCGNFRIKWFFCHAIICWRCTARGCPSASAIVLVPVALCTIFQSWLRRFSWFEAGSRWCCRVLRSSCLILTKCWLCNNVILQVFGKFRALSAVMFQTLVCRFHFVQACLLYRWRRRRFEHLFSIDLQKILGMCFVVLTKYAAVYQIRKVVGTWKN